MRMKPVRSIRYRRTTETRPALCYHRVIMWLFLSFGFFSIVQKEPGDTLTVRARFRVDLDRLRERVLPELSPTQVGGGTDYPYRATASRAQVRAALARCVDELNYANFKSEVSNTLGVERAHLYGKVWTTLYGAERAETEPEVRAARIERATGMRRWPEQNSSARLRSAYGGVIVNERGEVLLRHPQNGYGGYAWTWPKGRPNPGETPEAAAIRETQEETGLRVVIEREIPGEFVGDTSVTRFWIMRPTGVAGSHAAETDSIRWARLDEAAALIAETSSVVGRRRDLEVLAQVIALLERQP